MTDLSPKPGRLGVIVLIALHVAIAIPMAYALNVWADEASTLYGTQKGLWVAFQTAVAEQKQAPFYFWVLSIWRYASESIFFSRLFSLLCSAVAIRLFLGLANRLFNPKAAFLMTAFFALHPFLIWASLEIRVYSLVILLSIILMRLFFAGFMDDADEPAGPIYLNPKLWFLIAAIVSIYTNYYLGFLLVALFITLLLQGRLRSSAAYMALMFVAGIAFVPLALTVMSELQSRNAGFQEERSILEGLQIIWHHVLTFTLPTEIFPGPDQTGISFFRVWLLRAAMTVFAVFAVLNRRKITRDTVTVGFIAFATGGILLAAYFKVGGLYIALRHVSIFFVPFILFVGMLVKDVFSELPPKALRLAVIGSGITVLAFFSYAVLNLYPNMTKRGDWARVGEYIRQNESPNQPIMVFLPFDAIALPYYYQGVNRVLPDGRFFDFFTVDAPYGTEGSLKSATDFVISEIPADSNEIWLLVNEKCLTTVACKPLENFVNANYTVVQEKEFYLEKAILLRKKVNE